MFKSWNQIRTPLSSTAAEVSASSNIANIWSKQYSALLNTVNNLVEDDVTKKCVKTHINNPYAHWDSGHFVCTFNVINVLSHKLKLYCSVGLDDIAAAHTTCAVPHFQLHISLFLTCM